MAHVILLPGIMGSEIQVNYNGKFYTAWPATAESWIRPLEFTDPNTPKFVSKVGGVIMQISYLGLPVKTVYKTIYDAMSVAGHTVTPYPYDWRYNLGLLAYGDDTYSEQPSLKNFLINYHRQNPGVKPILVCHSMGGLVALNYLMNDPTTFNNIDKLILLGSPLFGAAKAYAALTSGLPPDPFYDWLPWAPSHLTWKLIERNFNSGYQLCPSTVLTEDLSNNSFVRINDVIQSYDDAYGQTTGGLVINDTVINLELLQNFVIGSAWITSLLINYKETINSMTYVIQGKDVKTPKHYKINYDKSWDLANVKDTDKSEKGDGTVLNYGFEEELGFMLNQNLFQFKNVDHLGLITNSSTVAKVVSLLGS